MNRIISLLGRVILLAFLLSGCESNKMPPSSIMWTRTESPLFPTDWPPSAETVWVSYTFAYGIDPTTLMDGSYVTAPLSKTEWRAGSGTTIILSDQMREAGIQGVTSLDEQARRILMTGRRVSQSCLALTALPDLDQNETKELLAYYGTWFQYNGTFVGLIRRDHAAFMDWILANQ